MRHTPRRTQRQATSCEPLENRAYAAKIVYGADYTLINQTLGLPAGSDSNSKPYGAMQTAVWKHGPASVIRTLEQSKALPRAVVKPYLDKSGTLYLRGTFGDDTIDLRNVGNGVIRINYVSFQNETARKSDLDKLPDPRYRMVPGSSTLAYQTSLTANTFLVKTADVRRIAIDGQAGVDTVRTKGLSVVPVTVAVEHAPVTTIASRNGPGLAFGAVLAAASSSQRVAAGILGSGPQQLLTEATDD